jgi:hypothetical protein
MTRNTFDDDYTSFTTGHLDSGGSFGLLVSFGLYGFNVVSMFTADCNFILIHNTIFHKFRKSAFDVTILLHLAHPSAIFDKQSTGKVRFAIHAHCPQVHRFKDLP